MDIKRYLAIFFGLGVVAGLIVVLGSRGTVAVVVNMDWTVGDSCPDAVVIGAAGSGQRDDVYGVGPQVASAVSGFEAQLMEQTSSSLNVGVMALDYPAPSLLDSGLFGFLGNNMFDSIAEGREALESLVGTIDERCQETLIYLIGYSQGAAVVHTAVVEMPRASWDSIGGVVVISDPNRDADDPNTQHFTSELDPVLVESATPHTRDGVLGGIASPTWLEGSFYSACARRDAVCNLSLLDVLIANVVHTDETYHGLGPQLGRLLADHMLTEE